MKEISDKLKEALANGYLANPNANLVIDIDPPYVGENFRSNSCDPDLAIIGGVMYLTIIEGDYIKILTVDRATHRVNGLVREILAPGAARPRLIFEPSHYPGWPDLPHVAYTDTVNGKAMVYREQYDENFDVIRIYDEIGNGGSCEALQVGGTIYNFYAGADGVLYGRKQGEFAEAVIMPEDGAAITSVRAMPMPDGRICLAYSMRAADGTESVHAAWTELLLPIVLDGDGSTMTPSLTALEWKKTEFWFGDYPEGGYVDPDDAGVQMIPSTIVEFIKTANQYDDVVEMVPSLIQMVFPAVHIFSDAVNMAPSLSQLALPVPHFFADDCQMTASLQAFEFFV